jgi:hypothetical protein
MGPHPHEFPRRDRGGGSVQRRRAPPDCHHIGIGSLRTGERKRVHFALLVLRADRVRQPRRRVDDQPGRHRPAATHAFALVRIRPVVVAGRHPPMAPGSTGFRTPTEASIRPGHRTAPGSPTTRISPATTSCTSRRPTARRSWTCRAWARGSRLPGRLTGAPFCSRRIAPTRTRGTRTYT